MPPRPMNIHRPGNRNTYTHYCTLQKVKAEERKETATRRQGSVSQEITCTHTQKHRHTHTHTHTHTLITVATKYCANSGAFQEQQSERHETGLCTLHRRRNIIMCPILDLYGVEWHHVARPTITGLYSAKQCYPTQPIPEFAVWWTAISMVLCHVTSCQHLKPLIYLCNREHQRQIAAES